MKITCAKNELLSSLRFASKAIASKPQTPLLSALYLKAEGDTAEVHGNNNETGLISKFHAEIEKPGEIAITGRYFQEVVTKLPGEEVTIDYDTTKKVAHITSAQADFRLLSMDARSYPTVKHFEGNLSFTVKDNVLREAIKKTVFACATDPNRPLFTGVSVQVRQDKVIWAATNSHRLAVNTMHLDDPTTSINMIVPGRFLQDVYHNLTSEVPIDVKVTCSYNSMSFEFENVFMTTRLLEGAFPDFNRVIPAEFETKVHLDTADFRAAVDRVSLIARSSEYNIILLDFENDKVLISSVNQEVGQANEDVAAQIDGPNISIAFNSQYIVDALKNIDSKTITFCMNQPLTAAQIIEDGVEDFVYVVTPVRTAR